MPHSSRMSRFTNQAVTSIAGQINTRRLNLKLKDYVKLVEWTGTNIVYPNKATMPATDSIHIKSTEYQPNPLAQSGKTLWYQLWPICW